MGFQASDSAVCILKPVDFEKPRFDFENKVTLCSWKHLVQLAVVVFVPVSAIRKSCL